MYTCVHVCVHVCLCASMYLCFVSIYVCSISMWICPCHDSCVEVRGPLTCVIFNWTRVTKRPFVQSFTLFYLSVGVWDGTHVMLSTIFLPFLHPASHLIIWLLAELLSSVSKENMKGMDIYC